MNYKKKIKNIPNNASPIFTPLTDYHIKGNLHGQFLEIVVILYDNITPVSMLFSHVCQMDCRNI